MTTATITPPRPRATATPTAPPSREPASGDSAKELAEHVTQGQALLDQARLIGEIGDYQAWSAARKPWIESTAKTLAHHYGSEPADKFKSAAAGIGGGGAWQSRYKRDSRCTGLAIDVLISLQGRAEVDQEPGAGSELTAEPADGPVHAQDAPEPFPGSLEQELEELTSNPAVGLEPAPAPVEPAPAPPVGLEFAPEPEGLSTAPSVGMVAHGPAGIGETVRAVAEGSSLATNAAASLTPDRARQLFLVGGRNEKWKLEVAGLLERTGPNEVTVLDEASNGGGELIEPREVQVAQLRYAVVLLTADDIGASRLDSEQEPYYSPRADQGAVFEMGFLVGALSPRCVCVLYEDGVERPYDLDGMSYIRLDPAGAWQAKLLLMLRSAGFDYDVNRLAPV